MFIKVHWQNVFNLERHGRVRGPFTLFHLFLFDVCVHYVGKARPTEKKKMGAWNRPFSEKTHWKTHWKTCFGQVSRDLGPRQQKARPSVQVNETALLAMRKHTAASSNPPKKKRKNMVLHLLV